MFKVVPIILTSIEAFLLLGSLQEFTILTLVYSGIVEQLSKSSIEPDAGV